jgi:hypothetical protein
MAFAILKLSYNAPGDSSLVGGICGTGFFVDSFTAVTAHHALNDETFRPNAGLQRVLVSGISRSGSIFGIQREDATLYPGIDAAILRLRNSVASFQIYEPSLRSAVEGVQVSGIGHIGSSMPSVDAEWQGPELVLRSASLADVTKDISGFVKRPMTLEINANDIKMHGVRGFELSFGSQVGMSGGPVIDRSTGKVLGMLSVGLPTDSNVKKQTFAVSIDEIWRYCRSIEP